MDGYGLVEVVAGLGMVLTISIVVATSVWQISSIRSATDKLGSEIQHLTRVVRRLTERLDQTEKLVHEQSVQIAEIKALQKV